MFTSKFCYWIKFHFYKKDTVEFLSNFCNLFFDLANKYEILSNNQLHTSPVYRTYIDNYRQYLNHHFKWSKFILPLLVSDVRDATRIGEIIQPVTRMNFYDKEGNVISEKVRYLWNDNYQAKFIESEDKAIFDKKKSFIPPIFSNPLKIVPFSIDIANKGLGDKVTYDFGITSHSDIWLDNANSYVGYEKSELKEMDNRPLAYRHTPRLNSFLRSLKAIVLEYEGTWVLDGDFNKLERRTNMKLSPDEESDKIWSDCAIPLDGKFIYQEDIDEGRIIIPD